MPIATTALTNLREDDGTSDNHWYGECAVRLLKSIPILTFISDTDPTARASLREVVFKVGTSVHYLKLLIQCASPTDNLWKFYTFALSVDGVTNITTQSANGYITNRDHASWSVLWGNSIFCDIRNLNVYWFKITDGKWFARTEGSLRRHDSDDTNLTLYRPLATYAYPDSYGDIHMYPVMVHDGANTFGLAHGVFGFDYKTSSYMFGAILKDNMGKVYIPGPNECILTDL